MLVEKINVNKKTICLRAETKANEYRTPLAPKDAAKLLKKNCRVLVEKSSYRCFKDEDYKKYRLSVNSGVFLVILLAPSKIQHFFRTKLCQAPVFTGKLFFCSPISSLKHGRLEIFLLAPDNFFLITLLRLLEQVEYGIRLLSFLPASKWFFYLHLFFLLASPFLYYIHVKLFLILI